MATASSSDIVSLSMRPIQYEVRASRGETSPKHGNNLPIIDLPSGTLLFRTIHLEDSSRDAGRSIFTDMLGLPTDTLGTESPVPPGFCLTPMQNVFTFPFPYIGFGLFDWTTNKPAWHKYNAFMVYVLSHNTPVVNMIFPSGDARGTPKGNRKRENSILRCDILGSPCFRDDRLRQKSLKYLSYDNCINPEYTIQTCVAGSIAISGDDSLDRKDARRQKMDPSKTPLGIYLKLLSTTNPGAASLYIMQLYADKDKLRGIPEIVVHTRRLKCGRERVNSTTSELSPIIRHSSTFEDSVALLIDDIRADSINITPVATITSNGIFDITGNIADTTGILSGNITAENQRKSIEQNLKIFLERGQADGIASFGRIMFDTRTGFYVCSNIAPGLMSIANGWKVHDGDRIRPIHYRDDLLLGMSTSEQLSNVIQYISKEAAPVRRESMFSLGAASFPYYKSFIFGRPLTSSQKTFSELGIITSIFGGEHASSHRRKTSKRKHKGGKLLLNNSMYTNTYINKRSTTTKNTKTKNNIDILSTAVESSTIIPIIIPSAPEPISDNTIHTLRRLYTGLHKVIAEKYNIYSK